jgi:hypothetical protein
MQVIEVQDFEAEGVGKRPFDTQAVGAAVGDKPLPGPDGVPLQQEKLAVI